MYRYVVAFAAVGVELTTAITSASWSLSLSFDKFAQKHNRTYSRGTAEYEQRRLLYQKRALEVEKQNRARARWTAAINKLADWTEDELQMLRGWNGDVRPLHSGDRPSRARRSFLQHVEELEMPDEKIWSNLETSNHIHNQGGCGACWAIATATVLEFHTEIHKGHRRTFSAQQIVSCTPNPRECGGSGRCSGATAELAFEYVLKNGCAESNEVPYTGQDGTCSQPELSPSFLMDRVFGGHSMGTESDRLKGGAAFGMTGWEVLPRNDQEPLMRAVVERGPVAISVAASDWNSYASGVFDGCSKDAIIDHAVVLVGFGKEALDGTWVIQNSWGSDWGENGHIRLLRHDSSDDYCGIDDKPQLGTACKGDNEPVRVCGMCGILFDSVVPHIS